MTPPQFVMIGGPNGAGKSTCAPALLPDGVPYVNADEIAKGLDDCDGRNVRAGRLLFAEWDRLARERADFAVEMTMASRSLAARIRHLREIGYRFDLIYLTLPSVDLAIARVAARVRAGGHDIPESTIRRRYALGPRHFQELYRPLADAWYVYQNVEPGRPKAVACSSDEAADDPERRLWGEGVVASAIARATREAVLEHKRDGRSIATMFGSEVRIVAPDDIEVRMEGEPV